jgi:farnesyl diphosphate synthase
MQTASATPAPDAATAPLSPATEFDAWASERAARVRALLDAALPQHERLGQAMHYAAALGGKRMRPLLVWAVGDAVDAQPAALDAAACAVELVHAYSLVHDDLPCMDDDVLRRGQPTAHVRFGEALALLAGDALQTRAFEVLTADAAVPAAVQARLCALLARAAGADGMAGGQAVDLQATGSTLDIDALGAMHRRKTGALLKASVLMGLACAPQRGDDCAAALGAYADAIGLAFQVVDDLLDVSADSATLGKTAGKDARQGKSTFVSLLGADAAQQLAQRLRDDALGALDALPAPVRARSARLAELARRIVSRSH